MRVLADTKEAQGKGWLGTGERERETQHVLQPLPPVDPIFEDGWWMVPRLGNGYDFYGRQILACTTRNGYWIDCDQFAIRMQVRCVSVCLCACAHEALGNRLHACFAFRSCFKLHGSLDMIERPVRELSIQHAYIYIYIYLFIHIGAWQPAA